MLDECVFRLSGAEILPVQPRLAEWGLMGPIHLHSISSSYPLSTIHHSANLGWMGKFSVSFSLKIWARTSDWKLWENGLNIAMLYTIEKLFFLYLSLAYNPCWKQKSPLKAVVYKSYICMTVFVVHFRKPWKCYRNPISRGGFPKWIPDFLCNFAPWTILWK